MATFVQMYHPQVPETSFTPAKVSLSSVDDWAARGWLLVSGGPLPEPSTPYYSKAAADSRFAHLDDDGSTLVVGGTPVAGGGGLTAEQIAADPTVRAAFGRGVSVTAYGAAGDGTTDDSAAFRTALATGKPVYVPSGTYRVSREGTTNAWALNLPAGARLHGPGKLVLAPGTAPSVRVIRIGTSDVHVDGLTIDGNRAAQSVETNPQRHGIIVSGGASNVRLTNLTLLANTGDGILVSGSTDVRIANCRITNCERNGVTLYASTASGGSVDSAAIIGCHIEADVQPIDSEPDVGTVTNVRILGNYLRAINGDYALTVAGQSANRSRGWSVIGNTLIGALYVIYQDAAQIIGNVIDARNSPTLNGVQGQYTSNDILLANNEIRTATDRYGINLQSVSGSRPAGWKILGNVIKTLGTAARGINITGAGATIVSDNTIRGANGEYGVYMQATNHLESLNVVDNSVEGFATGLYCAPFSTNEVRRLRILGNRVVNEEATPTATYGVRLAGTVAQFKSVIVRDNTVAATYTNPVSLGGVTVGPVLSYSRTGETAQTAAIRAALVSLGLVTDATTA